MRGLNYGPIPVSTGPPEGTLTGFSRAQRQKGHRSQILRPGIRAGYVFAYREPRGGLRHKTRLRPEAGRRRQRLVSGERHA